ncbi:hypothetical protein [Desulfosarcina ovata]|uniref:Uncharacterized protein n=1 Tax=Desulfosarcina ovata subsp. ovata TaxID=2752305 RepID=A0A5K8A7W4_9BACT|nr:hypothetical protein [Desulfosarcina ovata]BBO88498.1 hypothetical protein DSCOOX_16780 [Desulfosarcina ovata subsp. ovata]
MRNLQQINPIDHQKFHDKSQISLDKGSQACQIKIGKPYFAMSHIDHKAKRDLMFISDPLPFVIIYIEELDGVIKKYDAKAKISKIQKSWLAFCIMAIFVTRTVCWAKFERAFLGKKSGAAISWMFRRDKGTGTYYKMIDT